MPRRTAIALLALALVVPGAALAQTQPSAAEIAAYQGLFQAAHAGDVGALNALIAAGTDLNVRDGAGRTPAIVAAFAGQGEALRALAAAGADINAQDAEGFDVLMIAAAANNAGLADLALSLGARPTTVGGRDADTALVIAARLGHHQVVRRLLAAGAPVDHANNLGWTALLEAIVTGNGGPDFQETVKALLEGNANPELPARDGVTPIGVAQARNLTAIVELLEAAARR